jgi:hypothetical protein
VTCGKDEIVIQRDVRRMRRVRDKGIGIRGQE